MRRLHLALAFAGIFAAFLAVGASLEPIFGIGKEQLNFDVHTAMLTAPIYAVVLFGCYALMTIGFALVRFGECPEASVSLAKEVEDIKAELKARKFQT